jgi:two-component system response regulator DesR
MRAGAAGFVVKDAPPGQLVDAVRRAHGGLREVDPVLAAESLSTGTSPLTDRERDVLLAAADGATVADLAERLHLSEGTVRNHLSAAAIGKTSARTRAEAVRLADERRLVVGDLSESCSSGWTPRGAYTMRSHVPPVLPERSLPWRS